MKRCCAAAVVVAAFAFRAAADEPAAREIVYPLYTVTVEEGTTNLLDEVTVSVLTEAEGTPSSVAFSTLSGNITTGTLAMARLPFKVAYGSGTVAGNSALSINYSGAGFTSVPCVVASYSTTGSNWSGDNGALKIYAKSATGATIIVGGNFNTARNIDWIAIGT